jgi:hypothetical protein
MEFPAQEDRTMPQTREVALAGLVKPGGFSEERIVEVALPGGGVQAVLAPRRYCWTREGTPLGTDEPAAGRTIEGLVAARGLGRTSEGLVLVDTPDGETFAVAADIVKPRPDKSEINSRVPV